MRRPVTAAIGLLGLCFTACSSAPPPPPDSCPAPTMGPTKHMAQTISDAQTWTADTSPHQITGEITIAPAGSLTLEPCATVQLAGGAFLTVKGTLSSDGTATRPIGFAQRDSGQRWASIVISPPGSAHLAHTTISGGGGMGGVTAGASVHVQGSSALPIVKPLFVDTVAVSDSAGPGISLTETAGFADGSQNLTITTSGVAPTMTALSGPVPLRINLNAVSTIPSGSYTGNAVDEIVIVGDAPTSGMTTDATLHNRGVPYHVGGGMGGNPELRVTDDQGGLATLTIEPGVVLRFEKNGLFAIGHFSGNGAPRGALIAVGTDSSRIVLTSAAAQPAAGDWQGLSYLNTLSATDRLEFVDVQFAGGPCGCSGFSCGPVLSPGVVDDAAIGVFNIPPAAFIKSTRISDSKAHGITRGWKGPADVSFLTDGSNTFANVPGCKETFPKDMNGSCPATPPCPK